MNKSELITAMSEGAGISKTSAKLALEAFTDSISNSLKSGDRVALVGFGSFYIHKRKAGSGRNPSTGQPINIPAKNLVKFKAGKALQDDMN